MPGWCQPVLCHPCVRACVRTFPALRNLPAAPCFYRGKGLSCQELIPLPRPCGGSTGLTFPGRHKGLLFLLWDEVDVWQRAGAEVGAGCRGLPASPLSPEAPLRSSRSVPQPPPHHSTGHSVTQEAVQPDVPSTPNQAVALPRPPCIFARETGPQESPQCQLTQVRTSNHELGHPECENAARGDGDCLLLAQVALALALRGRPGLSHGLLQGSA